MPHMTVGGEDPAGVLTRPARGEMAWWRDTDCEDRSNRICVYQCCEIFRLELNSLNCSPQ
jgi:hypothetical protein